MRTFRSIIITIALLAAAVGARAQVAFDAASPASNSSSTAVANLTMSLTCSAGDCVVVFVAEPTTTRTFSVSGGTGCTWTETANNASATLNQAAIFVAPNVSANSSQTITVTSYVASVATSASFATVMIAFSGAGLSSSAVTAAYGDYSTTNTTYQATIATPVSNCLVCGFSFVSGGSLTFSAGTGYTIPAGATTSSGMFTLKATGEYANALTSTASNVSPTMTLSSTSTGNFYAVAIAPPAASRPSFMLMGVGT